MLNPLSPHTHTCAKTNLCNSKQDTHLCLSLSSHTAKQRLPLAQKGPDSHRYPHSLFAVHRNMTAPWDLAVSNPVLHRLTLCMTGIRRAFLTQNSSSLSQWVSKACVPIFCRQSDFWNGHLSWMIASRDAQTLLHLGFVRMDGYQHTLFYSWVLELAWSTKGKILSWSGTS